MRKCVSNNRNPTKPSEPIRKRGYKKKKSMDAVENLKTIKVKVQDWKCLAKNQTK